MKKKSIGNKIIFLHSVDSTNNYTANLLKQDKIHHGTVIMADKQRNGRGQRNKIWQSVAFENLTVTIASNLKLWKIENIITLNHIISLSVAHFLRKYTDNVKIKWPNDVMANNKKITGILIETLLSSTQKKAIIGCGININQQNFDHPRATSLYLETHQKRRPKKMVFDLLDSLEEILALYTKNGEKYMFQEYNKNLWLKGEITECIIGQEKVSAKIISTTKQGKLIAEIGGKQHEFANGELKH